MVGEVVVIGVFIRGVGVVVYVCSGQIKKPKHCSGGRSGRMLWCHCVVDWLTSLTKHLSKPGEAFPKASRL